jgi:hypothetical protein
MNLIFKHLFYRSYWWNAKIIKDNSPVSGGAITVSLFKNINLLTFIFPLIEILKIRGGSRLLLIIASSILIILTDLYYFVYKKNFEIIISETNLLEKKQLMKRDRILLIYVLFSIVSLIFVVTVFRSNRLL